MAGQRRLGPDAVRARMIAWQAEWAAVATSTARSDRGRAEAAVAELFETAGRPRPQFLWVGSPQAGATAYSVARIARRGIMSEYARGDVGNGANREFNGLAEPFGMDPVWTRRLAGSLPARLAGEHRAAASSADPYRAAARALGSTTFRLADLLRRTTQRATPDAAGSEGHAGPSIDLLADALGPSWTRVRDAIGEELARELYLEAIRATARTVIARHRERNGADPVAQAMQLGQFDARTPVLAAARDVVGGHIWRHRHRRDEHERQIALRLEIARSTGPWWAADGLAILSERPLAIHVDDAGRPHHPTGPAIVWPGGAEVYAWHGMAVDAWVIRQPETITVAAIDDAANVETRRVLVERYGEARLIREGGAELVHEDETGRLWRRSFGTEYSWPRREEPVVMVEVQNATLETDGSRRTYFLRVPPTVRTAREAVAWTFGLGAIEYRPSAEA
jgi:hypothetical protein